MKLTINGKSHQFETDANTPLLWVLRDILGLTGTKFGCGIAQCGACTVLVDGKAIRSCSYPVSLLKEDSNITTIEGLQALTELQKAWQEHQVAQCGYCQSGQIMAATALLAQNKNPTDTDIDAAMTNICRCGTYPRIRAAIKAVAAMRRRGES